jgi:aspartyl-tRNA(Asn)/glutamyl-tRNA(Gln) amidotransferase subunit A
VAEAVRRAGVEAARLGARVIPLRVPDIAALNAVGRVILLAEASAAMANFMDRRGDFGADVLALLDQGRLLAATDYINAQRLRRLMRREFSEIWKQVDCLLTPTTPSTAPKIGQTRLEFGGEVGTCASPPQNLCAASMCSARRRCRCRTGWTHWGCRSACRSSAGRLKKLSF